MKGYAGVVSISAPFIIKVPIGEASFNSFEIILRQSEDISELVCSEKWQSLHCRQALQQLLLFFKAERSGVHIGDQGRDVGFPTPPSQIPACGITAPGSSGMRAGGTSIMIGL
jgi:hypothetical protein